MGKPLLTTTTNPYVGKQRRDLETNSKERDELGDSIMRLFPECSRGTIRKPFPL